MPNLQLPLSGDVIQAINPWSWVQRAVGNQISFFSFNLGKTPDPELEERILDDVGTYGRQLGQIGDALAVLLRHVPLDRLSAEEREAIDAFEAQLAAIERVKARHRARRPR